MMRQTPAFLRGWAFFSLIACGLLSACGVQTGDACQAPGDCPGKLCLTKSDGFAGGYCSADCTSAACGDGQECRAIGDGGKAVCLSRCQGGGCRAGYQCYQGVCQPACTSDASCGNRGYLCRAGACVERPGAKLGAACAADAECSSAACIGGRCAQSCDRDQACQEGETCTLDRDADELRGYCVKRRGGAAPLDAKGCKADAGCDRGSCLMGACLTFCQTAADCGGAARTCSKLPAPLLSLTDRTDWPEARVCLPRNQVLTTDISADKDLLVPETARSVLLFTSADQFDQQVEVGMKSFRQPDRRLLYQFSDTDPTLYFRNPIRHYPEGGSASFLFSSSPQRAQVALGAYPFETRAVDARGGVETARVQAIYKLFDAPLTKGSVPLRLHVTDMSGLPSGCAYRDLTAQNAPTRLSTMVARLKQIYAQPTAGIRLDPITFVDSAAPTSVSSDTAGSLERVLAAASEDTAGGLDLVLVRSISPSGVLGIAGGIPAAPGIKGSPHNGAVASMVVLCIPQYQIDQEEFATTVAHELGHTMGLSHNREQNGQSDPLGDGTGRSESYLQNTDNLMYWSEGDTPAYDLTAEQGQVMRSMPQVQPEGVSP